MHSTAPPTVGNLGYQISDTCNTIDICVPVPEINRNVHAFLSIQPCDARITVGIEEFKFDIMFNEFEWGNIFYFSSSCAF